MTWTKLFAILLRRWYVLATLLATTVVVAIAVGVPEEVYTTETEVLFLPPGLSGDGNVLKGPGDNLVAFAAIIEREYNNGDSPMRFSSSSGSLYGSGVRRGHSVSLPNTGGQWAPNFNRPALVIQVVDSSEDRVRAELSEVVGDINKLTLTQQQKIGVASPNLITTELAPPSPAVERVSGSRLRASAAAEALGIVLSVLLTVAADKWLPPFSVSFGRGGQGPNRRKPRVVVIPVLGRGDRSAT